MLIPECGGGPSDASESPTTLPISIASSLPPSITPLRHNTADDTEDEGNIEDERGAEVDNKFERKILMPNERIWL